MADTQFVPLLIHIAGSTRTTTYQGRNFLVVPAVLVQGQVLHNNIGRTFLPPNEITAEWAEHWNSIPVLVGPHPSRRGMPVSGRDPAILNERGVGFLFNTSADMQDGVARLTAEVWLDLSLQENVEGYAEVLAQLNDGTPVELSTGFNTHILQQQGVFNGAEYDFVLQPEGADHLVISATMTGACSVSDGCGLGVNQECPYEATTVSDITQGDPDPIVTEALDKVKLLGLLKDAVATVENECGCKDTADNDELDPGKDAENVRLWDRITGLVKKLGVKNAEGPSDDEKRGLLADALQGQLGNNNTHVIVIDVFTEEGEVVFWFDTPLGPEPPGSEFFLARFEETQTANGIGEFTFSEPEIVRRMVKYQPVASNEEVIDVDGTKDGDQKVVDTPKADAQAGNATDGGKAPTGEGADAQAADAQAANEELAAAKAENESLKAENESVRTKLDELTSTVAELKAVTQPAVDEAERERKSLVEALAGNDKVPFDQAELESKAVAELRKLHAMSRGENYAMRGGADPTTVQTTSNEQQYVEPKPYYAKDKEGDK